MSIKGTGMYWTITQQPNTRSFDVFSSLKLEYLWRVLRRTWYVFSFRVVFFYLVTTGWIFLHHQLNNNNRSGLNHTQQYTWLPIRYVVTKRYQGQQVTSWWQPATQTNRDPNRDKKLRDSTSDGTDQYQNGSLNLLYSISKAASIDSDCCRLPTTSVLSNKSDKYVPTSYVRIRPINHSINQSNPRYYLGSYPFCSPFFRHIWA